MSNHQLTKYQRHELGALLLGQKHSYRQIAKLLGVHHATISRELARHPAPTSTGYHATTARLQLASTRLAANQSKRKLPTNEQLVATVTKLLKRNWSPEQIAGWFVEQGRESRVCAQTIYDWLYVHARHLLKHLHCRKGKYRATRQATLRKAFRQVQKEQRHISKRPARIEHRKTYGHWEGNTVRGYKGDGFIATFVERKSGYLLAYKIPRVTAEGFERAAKQCFVMVTDKYRKTLTLDNGSEMNNYEAIENHTGLQVHFATPYHSWERGTNENTNGLLRHYFPKQMSFAHLNQKQLDQVVREINTRPRKRLGYKTPSQVLKVSGAIRIGV